MKGIQFPLRALGLCGRRLANGTKHCGEPFEHSGHCVPVDKNWEPCVPETGPNGDWVAGTLK